MKLYTLLLISCFFVTSALAQRPRQPKIQAPPSPPVFITVKQPSLASSSSLQNIITKDQEGKLLSPAAKILYNQVRQGYIWERKGMKMLAQDSVYKIALSFHKDEDVEITSFVAESDIDLPLPKGEAYGFNQTLQWCSMVPTGNVIKLLDTKNKVVASYQIILNKSKTRVLSLKDLRYGYTLLPAETAALLASPSLEK